METAHGKQKMCMVRGDSERDECVKSIAIMHVALYEKMQQGPAVHMLGCYNLKTIHDITNI